LPTQTGQSVGTDRGLQPHEKLTLETVHRYPRRDLPDLWWVGANHHLQRGSL